MNIKHTLTNTVLLMVLAATPLQASTVLPSTNIDQAVVEQIANDYAPTSMYQVSRIDSPHLTYQLPTELEDELYQLEQPKDATSTKKAKVVRITTAPAPQSYLDPLFEKYGQEYNVSPSVLKRISFCESGYRPGAVNPTGTFVGLYQFHPATWSSNRKAMGLDPNPELRVMPEEAIRTAAFKISRDGVGAWPVCGPRAIASN